jgi:hypothetical protein
MRNNARLSALMVTLAGMSLLMSWPSSSLHAVSTLQSAVASPPTLVQHVSTSTNQNENGNTFIINLPNAALLNNCVIMAVTYRTSSSRNVTITDNIGSNTWVSGPSTNNGTLTTSLYYVLGVKAGTQTVTITFDAALTNFQAVLSEFYNVATSAALDGSIGTSTAAAPGVAAGSMSTAGDGDLVYQYAVGLDSGTVGGGSQSSGIAAGSGFTLLSADTVLNAAAQYQVQGAHGAINPGLTVAGSTDRFNTVAVALKSAAAGTTPPPGIRIVHKYDSLPPMPTTVQFPSSGNLVIASFTVPTDEELISSVTDNLGNNYVNPLGSGWPQMYYAAAAATGQNMKLSLSASGPSGGRQDLTMYDVTGAAASPFDKIANVWGEMTSVNADITHAPDIAPSTSNGLVIALLAMGIGPPSANIGSGYIFDSVFYTGQSDASVMTYGEGRSHVYNANTSTLSFGYHVHNDGTLSSYYGSAVAFKAGAVGNAPPSAPTGFTVTVH